MATKSDKPERARTDAEKESSSVLPWERTDMVDRLKESFYGLLYERDLR